jgi:hypothetical protein
MFAIQMTLDIRNDTIAIGPSVPIAALDMSRIYINEKITYDGWFPSFDCWLQMRHPTYGDLGFARSNGPLITGRLVGAVFDSRGYACSQQGEVLLLLSPCSGSTDDCGSAGLMSAGEEKVVETC